MVVPMPAQPSRSFEARQICSLARSTARRSASSVGEMGARISSSSTRTAMALATSPALWPPMPSATAQKRSPGLGA